MPNMVGAGGPERGVWGRRSPKTAIWVKPRSPPPPTPSPAACVRPSWFPKPCLTPLHPALSSNRCTSRETVTTSWTDLWRHLACPPTTSAAATEAASSRPGWMTLRPRSRRSLMLPSRPLLPGAVTRGLRVRDSGAILQRALPPALLQQLCWIESTDRSRLLCVYYCKP